LTGFFDALTTAILPVFAVPALAYGVGRRRVFDRASAEGINRFVFLLAIPAITFYLIVTADVSAFAWEPLLTYFACELVLYASTALLARYAFGVGPRESLLLGMTCSFSNTVIFVLPIASTLYGDAAALPVVAVITLDSTIVFGSTVIVMDVLDHREGGVRKVLGMLLRNPLVVALGMGAAVAVFRIPLHPGIVTFTRFVGNAAPPASLFALGVIMSAVPLHRFGGVSLVTALVKVAAMPLIVYAMMAERGQTGAWAEMMPLIAAGPCGAMPFVIALRYGVATDRIAAAIVMSTVASTFILAVLA
jgi:malonate transporter